MPTPLQSLLHTYRDQSQTQREKGTYFEELIRTWFRHEATYADLYSDVWLYGDWARQQGKDARDVGIDLVAKTETGEYHAIQCKFHAPDYRIKKSDIDSFFTASGQAPFTHRIIVSTSIVWSEHADDALRDQTPPVTKIDLTALEESRIDWSRYRPGAPVALKAKKELRPHQENALTAVKTGLQRAGRGKLIMACGTGKTFTSLKIAEAMAGAGKRVLFLVPSLALLSQILTEWTQESETPLHSFAVCSDREVGKKRPRNANRDDARNNEDRVETFAHELRYPATTDARALAQEVAKRHDAGHMSVVFSTYHSIGVISEAQHYHDLEEFDLIVCDEAHRTTGATYTEEDDSNFVKIHDGEYIQGKKRLYMTATPRIYGDMAQAIAERGEVALYSMDNPEHYGKDLHTLTFSEAVNRGLLVDYKVIVLAMDEAHISRRLQNLLKDENNALRMDDAAKIVGCWKALNKHQTEEERQNPDPEPMRRAVAFCQVIEPKAPKGIRNTHKVSSKQIAGMFQAVVEAYQRHDSEYGTLTCQAEHVDGGMNASQKEAKLSWLRADPPENTCRILSNVRCLSEGVDVPALDAVLFLTPRNSQVDVVQSVGRVMRNAPGKTRGYVILPVVIPAGVKPHEALADNRTYKVVWEVLQALRSHDDRFDAMINKMDLTGAPPAKMEVIAIDDRAIRGAKQRRQNLMEKLRAQAHGGQNIGLSVAEPITPYQTEIEFAPGEVERALYAKIVEKCGRRTYWEEWATDIAKIARAHITRIQTILQNPANRKERRAFHAFVAELRDDLNPAITEAEVVEMLAQHLITRPVFEALFEGYSFAANNPVSQGMQQVLDLLHEHHLEKEADTLEGFYASVKMRAEGIDSAAGKQRIVVELYDKFFRNAFPRMTERLGIVYTPVEVVDFILHSIDHLLREEFGQTLGSRGVHILDPFTGTGTFITRLIQSGLITPEELPDKYQHEIHANEIVLLAYYIGSSRARRFKLLKISMLTKYVVTKNFISI
uniref:Helicase conserved C-terminal domain-containing protein n=2 Tax=Candidatus Kentrum sp. FM TaxID=2126340 RepID=A0A450SYN8_9GAMM|nr:MAG: Helicase conserved C-terminal domain-containing protein [Candidatus Kentron sp. FM]